MSSDNFGMFGAIIGEAVEALVEEHDREFDKRAAMFSVLAPSLMQEDDCLVFHFRMKKSGNDRSECDILLGPEATENHKGSKRAPLVTLRASGRCKCQTHTQFEGCPHTLAASWWLHEQLTRRDPEDIEDFFATLTVDPDAQGDVFVDHIVAITEAAAVPSIPATENSRVQWRVQLNSDRYLKNLTINAFEQRPRKNGKGWTKGREINSFQIDEHLVDVLSPIDAQVLALVEMASDSYRDANYATFQALNLLVGQPNVAWNDGEATPVQVCRGDLTVSLIEVEGSKSEVAKAGASKKAASQAEASTSEVDAEPSPSEEDLNPWETLSTLEQLAGKRYRVELSLPSLKFNIEHSDVQAYRGYANPLQSVLVLSSQSQAKIVICDLKDVRAESLVEFLIREPIHEFRLNAAAAAKLAAACGAIDPLISLRLPDQLSGPLEEIETLLAIELRPRTQVGLSIAVRIQEPRFAQSLVPGVEPDVVRCVTADGPVRLKRNLEHESHLAGEWVTRFRLSDLQPDAPYSWVATTDEMALELLGRLYQAGPDAPVILWPDGQSLKVRGEITPSSLRVKLDDRKDWFGLSGFVEIDGTQVQLSDLLTAVQENRNLVRVGDREFAQISDAFRKRLQQLSDAIVTERGQMRVAQAAAPMVSDLLGDDVILDADIKWQQTLHQLEAIRNWQPEVPEGLSATLRQYQVEGYQWLSRLSRWGVGAILADDMGLGKTVQTLGVLLNRGVDGPALIVAPTSVGDNWLREAARFASQLKAHLYREHDRQQLIDDAGPNDLVITSYQLLQRDAERFASRQWNTLVLDEAQFIKNAQTKTAQAIRGIQANWRIGLSGTPLENHLGELWSLFRTLSPGLLGSWERFRTRFAEPIERQKDDDRRESLAQLVRPFILRRTKSTVLTELPPRTEVTLYAELSKAEQGRYEDARISAISELSGTGSGNDGEQRMKTLAWLTKLRQLACHPRMVDRTWRIGSAKLSLFMETVDELREGEHRALVFSQFVKHLDLVREALDQRGIRYQYLDGSTPAAERQRRVDAFQNGEGDLFLISLKAGGTGLNLTAANYVIHLDPWWNPAVEDQATDRAHRIGQERAVTVYRLVSKGTIEEQILELHANKRELVASVLSGTDQAGRMSTDELINLIRTGF